ncbi:hypothetical protein BDA96_02G204900 [Sorghum bicolor]|jgi:hypothetical protein|uniref:Uncharacterized protein n=2 Tax=Sorghum bicolor TaxID=4558 RepID=A0A921UT82_SORBI|nr:hypothetical protein BDA96_02G204900 [Sorghum bicolor]OQU89461.1 hypothetical protein SORBI_3002G194650 [Sorghum bicolor]
MVSFRFDPAGGLLHATRIRYMDKCLQLHSELDMHSDAFEKHDTRKRSLRLRVYLFISLSICQPPPRVPASSVKQAFLSRGNLGESDVVCRSGKLLLMGDR